MTGVPPAQLLDILDGALEARLLDETPGAPGRLRFSHALVRDTLYQDLTPSRRARLHGVAGEALEALYAGNPEPHLSELAHHFASAVPAIDPSRAIAYARRAGDRAAALLAFESAADLYRLALQLIDAEEPATATESCELLLARADVQARAGDMPAARETFLHAADIARETGTAALLARAALGYGGRLVFTRGDAEREVVPLLEQAAAALRDDETPLRARVLARLASALRNEPTRMRRESLSEDALAMARRLSDGATVAYALSGRLRAGPAAGQAG